MMNESALHMPFVGVDGASQKGAAPLIGVEAVGADIVRDHMGDEVIDRAALLQALPYGGRGNMIGVEIDGAAVNPIVIRLQAGVLRWSLRSLPGGWGVA